jgi:hypothetical protein
MKRWAAEMAPICDADIRYHAATEENFVRDFCFIDLEKVRTLDFEASSQLTASFMTSTTTQNLERRIEEMYGDYCRLSFRWRSMEREFAVIMSVLEEEFPTAALRAQDQRRYNTMYALARSLKQRKLDLRNSSLTLHGTIVLLMKMLGARYAPSGAPAGHVISATTPASSGVSQKRSLPSFDLEIEFVV